MITATIISSLDLSVLDVIDVSTFSIEKTIDFSGTSSIEVHRELYINESDYIILKDKAEILTYGIISKMENEDGKRLHTIYFKEIESIFDRDIILEREDLIQSHGIEVFVGYTMMRNFISSEDSMINKPYIKVFMIGMTSMYSKVETENGIYNLKTYMANLYEKYGIGYTFRLVGKELHIYIQKKDDISLKINTEVSDIANYSEVYETNIISKLTAVWKQPDIVNSDSTVTVGKTAIYHFFLLSDRTISTDMNHPERANGDIVTEYFEFETYEELYEEVVQRFRSNSYQHSVEADISKTSKLYPIEDLYVGRECVIKTRSYGIKDSIITKVLISSKSQFISIKFGNLNITLLEKLRKR